MDSGDVNAYIKDITGEDFSAKDIGLGREAKIAQKFKRQYAKLTSDEIMVLAFLRKRLDSLKAAA